MHQFHEQQIKYALAFAERGQQVLVLYGLRDAQCPVKGLKLANADETYGVLIDVQYERLFQTVIAFGVLVPRVQAWSELLSCHRVANAPLIHAMASCH